MAVPRSPKPVSKKKRPWTLVLLSLFALWLWKRESQDVSVLTASVASKLTTEELLKRAVTNKPRIPSYNGLTDATDLTKFNKLIPFEQAPLIYNPLTGVTPSGQRAMDNEDYDALTRYFWGKEEGIVMELGALDGKSWSVSKYFQQFKWHRLLVEANPTTAANGPNNSPDATFVHCAICAQQSVVHYLQLIGGKGEVSGILEFMTKDFLKIFHPEIMKLVNQGKEIGEINWAEYNKAHTGAMGGLWGGKRVHEIPCLDLASIFRYLGIGHINFFMLDTEGAEYSILQSIDWDAVTFDVLAIETEPFNSEGLREAGYAQKVKDFIITKGYLHDNDAGRNSWFIHQSFVPSKKPET